MIFGICDALRCDELTNLKFNDVEDNRTRFIVLIRDTKTYIDRQFIIGSNFYALVKKYINLRPSEDFTDRFFINYNKGKCIRQVIGKNKIGDVPKLIASFLNLKDPKTYTGHCFRRTAATLLSDSGARVQTLKQLGGWRSETVALGYVENSMHVKENIYKRIIHASTSGTTNPQPSTSANSEPPPVIHTQDEQNHTKTSDARPPNNLDELAIDWGDFVEDFDISSAKFATATGKAIAVPKNTKVAHMMDLPSTSTDEPGMRSAPKQHFLDKKSVKLQFYDGVEHAAEKTKTDIG